MGGESAQKKVSRKIPGKILQNLHHTKPQHTFFGNGPNTVSESTVSSTELSEFLLAFTEFWGESHSEFLSEYHLCAKANSQSFAELTEFAAELSEFSLGKIEWGVFGIWILK